MRKATLVTVEDEIRQQEQLIVDATARLEKLRAVRAILSDLASERRPKRPSSSTAGRDHEGRATLASRVELSLRQRGPLPRRAIIDHIIATNPSKRRSEQLERVLSVSLTRMKARGLVENESGLWRLKQPG